MERVMVVNDEAGPGLERDEFPLPDWAAATPEVVRIAVEALAPPLRQALLLRVRERVSYREMADRLGILPVTVGMRLVQARQSLRAILIDLMASQGAEA